MDDSIKTKRKPNPRENAFALSAISLSYTIPTFIQGFKRDLEEQDLTETLNEHKSALLGNLMEKYWKEEEYRAFRKNIKPSLLRVLIRAFGWKLTFYGIFIFMSEGIRIAQPVFLGKLLQFYMPNESEVTQQQAYGYAAGVVLCSLMNVLFYHPYMMAARHLGMKLRVACCSLIYRKSLKLSKSALGQTTIGQVVNLLSNDVNRFDIAMLFGHYLWLGPLQTIFCTYLMYLQVGISAVVGVVLLILSIPMQIYIGKKVSTLRLKTALRTDERVRLMSEIISGIHVIKMYAWEKPFVKLVKTVRRFEIEAIKKSSFMKGIQLSFTMYSTRMSIFASILAYVLLGNDINAIKVFVLTSFYNILRQTMTSSFPQGISQLAEALVSIERLNTYMNYEETEIATAIKEANFDKTKRNDVKLNVSSQNQDLGIFIKNANAKWTNTSLSNTLSNINLTVTPGKLLAVIGPVGSGKSSLLHMILQELPLTSGSLQVNGEISYASQEPWLFAGSVRQNILFGLPMDKTRYNTIVEKCCLERDFQLLPYGDKTIVGDRGVSLSGGQRARINLARAVYKQADIYLLDDPLSAVDTHVGKALFEECVTGFLKDKIVVLVTHQLQYLKEVDHILYLDNGIPKAQGSYKELEQSGLEFLVSYQNPEDETDKKHVRRMSHQTRESIKPIIKSVKSLDTKAPTQVEEQKSSGSIGSKIYGAYFKAGGNVCTISMTFLLFILAQILGSMIDYFITHWVNIEQQDFNKTSISSISTKALSNKTEMLPLTTLRPGYLLDWVANESLLTKIYEDLNGFWHFSRETCIIIYSTLIAVLVTFTLIRGFIFFVVCMRASTNLHNNMFKSITRATMRFFNTNSAGRILNRFSKDMGAIDELLTSSLLDVLQNGLALVGTVIVVAIVNLLLLVPTVVVTIIFYFMRRVYLKTSRSIKRLEGTTRSPVFSHLSATLKGLTTIRAFKAENILAKEFDNHQDLHSSAFFAFIATARAFAYWLDVVCIVYIALVTFSFLLIGNETYGGNVGLAITQVIGITGILQWGMRQSTELENQMTSVERVLEYSNIEHEAALESTPSKKPPSYWPSEGKIEFKHVYLKYSPDDPPVLKDVSFVIEPKQKIGIVGRTGAGKSTIINALLQLFETTGTIIIDDIDINQIGLHDLRSKISIIPQEPVLFSGTMRKNLDPFDEYNDSDLWKALEDVELKEEVQDLKSPMAEGGTNFSVGQRQLVCLARAILRKHNILVMDEATANVDPQTDALIQNTIRRKFEGCTVLTIAHRLHTVIDSDKILVMDAGTIKEYDHPFVLLQNQSGVLSSMVEEMGETMAATLYEMARHNFESHKNGKLVE